MTILPAGAAFGADAAPVSTGGAATFVLAAPAPVVPAGTAAVVPGSSADVVADGDTGLTWEKVLFLFFGGVTILLALGVVLLRNPLSGAVALIFSFFSLAALFALAEAHFVAVIQVLVYAGAIMVLFIFVIMLLNLSDRELGVPKGKMVKTLALLTLGILGFITWRGLGALDAPPLPSPLPRPEGFGTIRAVGTTLFQEWLLPFELTGVLLLVAVVGAVTLSRRGYRRKGGAPRPPTAALSPDARPPGAGSETAAGGGD